MLKEIRAMVSAPSDSWITVDQASSYLNIARATLYKWVHEGAIPHHKLPGSSPVRFRVSELNEWIRRGHNGSSETVNQVLRKLR
jgi:excisionase family DNA binding protein